MSMKYLGESFDIHGGGLDNQFPHHECEIAQSESATGKPFAKYWIHNNLVTANGQKMSKSLGNFVTLKDAFKKFDPIVVRFFILQSHYRSTLDFSEQAIEAAAKGLEKLQSTIERLRAEIVKEQNGIAQFVESLEEYRKRFFDAMDDDFSAPLALGVLFEVARETNELLANSQNASHEFLVKLNEFFALTGDQILGILSEKQNAGEQSLEPQLIDLFLKVRGSARQRNEWRTADDIRQGLKGLRIEVQDIKDGTTWKKV